MSSLPFQMPDLKLNRRGEEPDPDREALEHIARALESRRFQRQDESASRNDGEAPEFFLPAQSVKALLEGLPVAIAVLSGGAIADANSAFANAFGYPSAAELIEAGGLSAILGEGTLAREPGPEQSLSIEAFTRSRRRVKVAFALGVLDAERDLALLRLIDPPAAEDEAAAAPATPPEAAKPEALPRREADAATSRLEFLAKVSHEVRTPLNSIIGFAELMLQERFGPIGSKRYKGYVEDIHQSGLYALSLLNDLLDISKIEAGKFELNFTAVDVGEVVEDCAASLQPLAKRARIVLRTSLAPDLPTVVADPRRLKQILLNLLTNAIKFTDEGGQVIVSGSMIEGELRLRVRDNGVGMTRDEIAFAMQPFHQLDTAPRKQTGTGLGLPVTKALTDANRARLVLTSEPGVGTAADVIFPAERLFTSG